MTLTASGEVAGWKSALGYVGGAVLGAVLLIGAWAKALDPSAFAEQIGAERLDFWLSAQVVVFVALGLEIALGSALLLGVRQRLLVLCPAVLLVVFFLFLTGRAYYRALRGIAEETAGCGCFGNLVERTPAEAFWQDLALLVPALLLAFLGSSSRGASLPRVRLAVVGAFTLLGLVFAWRAPALPLDDLATRLKPGVELADVCAGRDQERICLLTIAPELEAGEHLVVIADLKDDSFGEAVETLSAYALAGHSLLVLAAATPEEHHAFFWKWGPAFEIREAPPSLLRPLYRTLPRSFVAAGGAVIATHSGLPPLAAPSAADATGG